MTKKTATAIMVLGMHRSGTSALTRVLNLLGADLPDDLMPANAFNESGYWEPSAVVALNDAWLARSQAAWDAPFVKDFSVPQTEIKTASKTLKAAYGEGHELIAIKDPRCTLFVPAWREALTQIGYNPVQLVIHRDPAEVAQSLAHRDHFTADEAGLLWAWYCLRSLKAYERDGGVVVSYSALRQDWRSVMERVRAGLELDSLRITEQAAEKVDAFLHEPRSASEADFNAEIRDVLTSVDELHRLAESGQALKGLAKLESDILKRAGQSRASIMRVRAEGREEAARLERDRDRARADQKATDESLTRERDAAREALRSEQARLEGERDTAREAYQAAVEKIGQLEVDIRAERQQTDHVRDELAQAQSRLTQLKRELSEADDALRTLTLDFKALEESVHAYQAHAQSLETDLAKAQADYVAADAERQALRVETVRLRAIEQSSIWKATTPLRAAMARLPGVRALVRKGLKASWWTVTGQLGARLKARQAAQLAAQLDAARAQEPGDAPSSAVKSPIKTLNAVLTEEFGDAASYIPELISRYELAFQSEGQAPIKTIVGDDAARKMAQRLAKIAAKRPETDMPDVSIVIPAYNQISYTLACIESVFASAPKASFEILVGDDQSTDGTQAAAAVSMAHVRWVRHETNQGFVGNCNLTAEQARGRIVLMLNNDTLVLPDWLDTLVDALDADPQIGLVGSKLIYPDGRLQEAGGIFWQDGSAWNLGRFDHPRRPEFSYARDVDYISGASIALPRKLWEKLGGFDDHYRPAYAEDADLAFRVRKEGLRTVFQPRSMLIHFEGVSSGTDLAAGAKAYQVQNLEKLRERWAGVLAAHRPNGQQPEREKERAVSKRVLFIDITTPEPQHDAGSLVAVETMRALQALGYKVTFVPVDNFLWTKAYSAPLQAMGVETIYHPFYSRFEPFISARGAEFDLVVVHRFGAAERVMGALRTHAPQAKIAFMPADLHFLREQREAELAGDKLALEQAEETRRRELAMIRSADAVLPHSDLEIELLKEAAPETQPFKLPLIHDPNPIATGFHGRSGVGFIGGYGHPPNVDAVDWFLSEIWPKVRAEKPDARFVLAGSKMPDRFKALDGRNGVKVLGFVDSIDAFFGDVRASIAPLRYGAGAKGKVAASLALGTPCVSTAIGAEGMGLTPGVDVLVANDPDGFARHILALLSDEIRWNELRQAGLDFARRETSREVVRDRLSLMLGHLGLR